MVRLDLLLTDLIAQKSNFLCFDDALIFIECEVVFLCCSKKFFHIAVMIGVLMPTDRHVVYMGCPISNLFRYEGMKLDIRNFAHLLLIMYGGYVQEVISL